MKLYIVEDSAIIRGRILSMISPLEHVEISGFSGFVSESIEEIKERKPDIIILDIRLNGGSGIDILTEIKNELPDSKIIMLTNYSYPQYRKKCFELGADYFFDKSKDFERKYGVHRMLTFNSVLFHISPHYFKHNILKSFDFQL